MQLGVVTKAPKLAESKTNFEEDPEPCIGVPKVSEPVYTKFLFPILSRLTMMSLASSNISSSEEASGA